MVVFSRLLQEQGGWNRKVLTVFLDGRWGVPHTSPPLSLCVCVCVSPPSPSLSLPPLHLSLSPSRLSLSASPPSLSLSLTHTVTHAIPNARSVPQAQRRGAPAVLRLPRGLGAQEGGRAVCGRAQVPVGRGQGPAEEAPEDGVRVRCKPGGEGVWVCAG